MNLLIIEDEKRIADNIKKYFEKNGFIVQIANTGQSGLELLETEEYDGIILDWMLPDMEGIDICKKLRTSKNDTPILILTAKSQLEDKLDGFDCGADDYLTKPFLLEELFARVKSIIRRNLAESNSPYLKIADLEININTTEVRRKNTKIDLAPKEYSLLEYLCLNQCKVLTRMQIMSHVWGDDLDMFSNTVDVHIRYLRVKIDNGFSKKLIKTIKNKGYMLCSN